MILYPTETIYGLGVNPFDQTAMQELFAVKGRDHAKVSAWLVRTISDMERYGVLSDTARAVAETFLPGRLTLVVPAKDSVPAGLRSASGAIGLRISADTHAQALIERHFVEHDAPLTCTSANVSGMSTEPTPEKIIQQFTDHQPDFTGFTEVIDDGERTGSGSTVVSVIGNNITVLRAGKITETEILSATSGV